MIGIKILCTYGEWEKYIDKDIPIKLVQENPDYFVIINYHNTFKFSDYEPSRTIVFSDLLIDKSKFLYYFDTNITWGLNMTSNEIRECTPVKIKNNKISCIFSSRNKQKYNHFINFLKEAENRLPINIFGWNNDQNFSSHVLSILIDKKDNRLFPYKYTIVYDRKNQKFVDAILSECLCFYDGTCDFLDSKCYISIDVKNINKSIETIKKAIEEHEWEKRIDIIREMKMRILTKLSIIPRLYGLIQVFEMPKRTINLDTRFDKWKVHYERCRDQQLSNISRYSAVKGNELNLNSPEIKNNIVFTYNIAGPDKNVHAIIGCIFSHYNIWLEVNATTLIMEDDVEFCDGFVDRLGYLLNQIKEIDWEVIFIGYHNHEENCRSHNISMNYLEENFTKTDLVTYKYMTRFGTQSDATGLHGGGTFGYLVSASGAKKLVDMVADRKFHFPIDYFILESAHYHDLKAFACPHRLVTSPKFGYDTTESDVQK